MLQGLCGSCQLCLEGTPATQTFSGLPLPLHLALTLISTPQRFSLASALQVTTWSLSHITLRYFYHSHMAT